MIVFVYGASGNSGKHTIEELAKHSAVKTIRIGSRDAAKAKAAFANIKHTNLEYFSDLSPAGLVKALNGVDALYLIVPGAQDRAAISTGVIKAAQEAKVKYVATISVLSAVDEEGLFGKQFGAIEKSVKDSGIPYCIIRAPCFLDNYWGQKDSIKSQGIMYSAGKAGAKFAYISAADIGKFSAQVLAFHTKYQNKIFTVTAPQTHSEDEFAHLFSKALGKPVKHVQTTEEQTKQGLMAVFPEWQAAGIVELWVIINSGKQDITTNDYFHVVGHPATTAQQFIESIAPAFK